VDTSKKRAIFFDLDDTLYDHLIPFREAVRHVLKPDESCLDYAELFIKVRHYSDELWPKYLSGEIPLEETRVRRMELAFADYGIEITHDQASAVQAAYIERQYTIDMLEGVREHIEQLLANGHKVGIITNGPEEHQMKKICGLGLDQILSKDMIFISDAVGLAKPDPKIFKYVNEKTGTLPENSLYVGDTWANDVVGALAAGWEVCWFNSRGRKPESEHKPSYECTNYKEFGELGLV